MPPAVVEVLGELWELPDPSLRDRWARCVRADAQGQKLAGVVNPYHWTSTVTVRSIEARAGEWLMFHAAGVSDDRGAVAALIGASGTGKSTAARTICRDHFGYVTDETVAVLGDSTVMPFPKPIAAAPCRGGAKMEFGPDELRLRSCPSKLELRALLLLERQPDLASATVERLGLLEGILAMVPHMSALSQVPSALARLADLADRCGGVYRVTYTDAAQLTNPVVEVLATGAIKSGYRQHLSGTMSDLPGLVRNVHHDAIELSGEVLIMQGSRCMLFRGVAGLVWLAADRARSFDDILLAVKETAGDHPDAERLLWAAVDELVSQGVLVSR